MRSTVHVTGAVACAAALALAGGCGQGAPGPHAAARPASHRVILRRVAFEPAALDVASGDTIAWENRDLVPHTVTARDRRFDSGNLAPDSTWRWVAAGADSVPYACTYHPTMRGVVRIARP